VFCQVHLFDIDMPGKISFRESETMSAGQHLTMFDTCWSYFQLTHCCHVNVNVMSVS